MKLVILDYELGTIDIIHNVPENSDPKFISDLGYKDAEVSWILLEDDALITRYTYDPISKRKKYDNENLLYDRC